MISSHRRGRARRCRARPPQLCQIPVHIRVLAVALQIFALDEGLDTLLNQLRIGLEEIQLRYDLRNQLRVVQGAAGLGRC